MPKKQWWFEWGDIDNAFDFYFQVEEPRGTYGIPYGPYKTFGEAKRELLKRFIGARDELNGCIKDVRNATVAKYKN